MLRRKTLLAGHAPVEARRVVGVVAAVAHVQRLEARRDARLVLLVARDAALLDEHGVAFDHKLLKVLVLHAHDLRAVLGPVEVEHGKVERVEEHRVSRLRLERELELHGLVRVDADGAERAVEAVSGTFRPVAVGRDDEVEGLAVAGRAGARVADLLRAVVGALAAEVVRRESRPGEVEFDGIGVAPGGRRCPTKRTIRTKNECKRRTRASNGVAVGAGVGAAVGYPSIVVPLTQNA